MKKRNKKIRQSFNDPQKGFDSTAKRIITVAIVIILVVMAGTYFFIEYKYGSFTNMFIGETTTTTQKQTSEKIEIIPVDGKRDYLIAVTSPGENELYNVFMVCVNMTDKKAYFTSVPVFTKDSSLKTLAQQYEIGGAAQLEYALERMFSVDFDGYFCATQNGYKFMLTELGTGIAYDVPEDLQFSTTDYTLALNAGKQELKFDTFVKLMRYTGWGGGSANTYKVQADLLKELFNQYCKPNFVTRDVEKYSYMMSYIKSDISSEDYINDLNTVEYIAASKFSATLIVPEGSFSGSGDDETFKYSQAGINKIKTAFNLTEKEDE